MVEELHRAAWQRLLAFVSGGTGDAGAAYRRMHSKLEAYFRWKGVEGGRELADKTLDRVARRLAAGGPISAPAADFILGMARAIAREQSGDKELLREVSLAEEHARLDALEACLLVLGDQDRALFAQFHARREPAFRLQASRIRARIERCMNVRLARAGRSNGQDVE